MEKHNRHIDNDSLDQLLRNFLLEEKNIRFTEKEMDMNAAMIFSGQPSMELPISKKDILINDLEALLKSDGRKRGLWLWLLGLLFLVSTGIYLFTRQTTQATVNPEVVSTEINNSTAPDINTTPGPSENMPAENIVFTSRDSGQIDSNVVNDSMQRQSLPTGAASNFNHTRMHIPEPVPYEEYPVLAPDPVFPAKPSPENLKVKKATFIVDTFKTGRTMFSTPQKTVTANYYEGEPFKNGMNDFVYINYGALSAKSNSNMELPWQVMTYSNPDDVTIVEHERQGNRYGSLRINSIAEKAVRLAVEPYYFSKYEVTNAEYKEFLQWVRVSNGYGNKPVVKVTIDTILMSDSLKGVSGENVEIHGKMYKLRRHVVWQEDNSKVFRYIFFNPSEELVTAIGSQSLNVFPDTVCWTSDFTFSFNEPMTNMYRWHPAYDGYPVVGVSWFQAMAFLDWKTYMHQKQFDVQNVPYMIEYSLPSEIEWELATLLRKQNGENVIDFRLGCSEGWMSNLGVQYSNDDAYDRPDYLKNLFTKDQYFRGDFIVDGYFHTGPSRLPKGADAHIGPVDLCWMDGNVSEWMMESYAENWKPFFDKHMAAMDIDKRESTVLAKQLEIYYDKGNAANGRLVRGSNWYDERFGSRPTSGVNEAGLSPRRYLDPNSQHSTVGFRYVVRVRFKDEQQRLK